MAKQNKKESTSATRESSKNTIYFGKSTPKHTKKGDLWFDTNGKNIVIKNI